MRIILVVFLLAGVVTVFAQDETPTLVEDMVIQAHDGSVRVAAWSPDGSQILTVGSYDKQIRLWDAATGDEIWTQEYSTSLEDASWSPDGSSIAVAWWFKLMFLDPATGEEMERLDVGNNSYRAQWSPDGSTILLRVRGDEPLFQLWDVETAGITRTLPATEILTSVAWSADSSLIATYSAWEGAISVIDVSSGEVVWFYDPEERVAETAAFSPESNLIVVAHAGPALITDSTVEVWDLETSEMLWSVEELASRVMTVAWSPDGRFVAGAGLAEDIWLFDAETGAELQFIENQHEDAILRLGWSPDSTRLLAADELGVVKIWALE